MKSILLIDDSKTIRTSIKNSIKSDIDIELNIIEAKDSKEAIHVLTENRVDLIITDLEMGGNDGELLITKLSNNPLLKKKAIIVFSSKKLGISVSENITYIAKPDVKLLCKTISNILKA